MARRQRSGVRQRCSSDPYGLSQIPITLREGTARIHLDCGIRYETVGPPIKVQGRFFSQPVTSHSLLE